MNAQYDEIASRYQQTRESPLRTELEVPSLMGLVGDPSGLQILDLACGDGFYSRLLAEQGAARVVGVDISKEMLALAQAAERRRPQGIEFHQYDVAELPNLGQFDLILGTYLLHYAPTERDLRKMCERIRANLAPQGRFLALNENPTYPQEIAGDYAAYGFSKTLHGEARSGARITYRMISGRHVFGFDVHYYSRSTYEATLAQSGFSRVRWHELGEGGNLSHSDGYFAAYLARPPIILLECHQ